MRDPGCFFHGDEPVPGEYFRFCFECGHYFLTDAEFADYAKASVGRPATDLTFCPLCSHDF